MQPYHDMLNCILKEGETRGDRTGVGTRSVFGYQARYSDVGTSFPLDTSREINFRQIVGELLWILRGNTNIRELACQGFNLWHDWPLKNYNTNNPDAPLSRKEFNDRIVADEAFAAQWGECGPIYGKQWRKWYAGFQMHPFYWPTEKPYEMFEESHAIAGEIQEADVQPVYVDQIANLVEDLKKNPLSRRHIVSAWNVADIPAMIPSGLPPCHVMFQFYCSQLTLGERRFIYANEFRHIGMEKDNDLSHEELDKENVEKYRLHCQLYQRSCDSVLGASYNIPSYALLTMMLAQQVNMIPGDFVHSIGDTHIYLNHIEGLRQQLARESRQAPTVKIRKAKDIFSYIVEDFELMGYDPHPPIHYKVAV